MFKPSLKVNATILSIFTFLDKSHDVLCTRTLVLSFFLILFIFYTMLRLNHATCRRDDITQWILAGRAHRKLPLIPEFLTRLGDQVVDNILKESSITVNDRVSLCILSFCASYFYLSSFLKFHSLYDSEIPVHIFKLLTISEFLLGWS